MITAPLEVIGLDHVYLAVRDIARAQTFYDPVMERLGFKKSDFVIAGEPHAHYFNRVIQISLRPARSQAPHDAYAAGLHHLCLQVASPAAVDAAAVALLELGVAITKPAPYPQYAPDYYALFFEDPDGLRFELVARRSGRDAVVANWHRLEGFLNPLKRLQESGSAD
jgi:catechol 2,3-dioxygenase-like lactoylglutathione lyase family enzyme